MLSQLPELQPAIPSSFLGIAGAALEAGTGGMSRLQQEKGEAFSCEIILGGRTGRLWCCWMEELCCPQEKAQLGF